MFEIINWKTAELAIVFKLQKDGDRGVQDIELKGIVGQRENSKDPTLRVKD